MKLAQGASGAVLGVAFANAVASTALPISELQRYGVIDPENECITSSDNRGNESIAEQVNGLFSDLAVNSNTQDIHDSLVASNTIICLSDIAQGGLFLHHINSMLLNPTSEVKYYDQNYEYLYTEIKQKTIPEILPTFIHEARHKSQMDLGVKASSLYAAQDKALIGKVMEGDAYAYSDYVMNGTPMLEGVKKWFKTNMRAEYEGQYLSNSLKSVAYTQFQTLTTDYLYRVSELPDGSNYLKDNDVDLFEDAYYGIAEPNQAIWVLVQRAEELEINSRNTDVANTLHP